MSNKIQEIVEDHLQTVQRSAVLLQDFCSSAAEICLESWKNGGHIYVCGNGGSAADATHIVGELVGRFQKERKGLRATCLGADFATMTAVANDYGYENIYAREVSAKAKHGDVLWCISTSGNSPNIIAAAKIAKEIGRIKVIGMTGKTGGKILPLCDACLCVPHTATARIQEVHELAYHIICYEIEQKM